jgi:hypothetical protein
LSWLKQRSTTSWPWYISGSEKHARPGRGLAAEDCARAPPAGLRAPKARLDPQEVNPAAERGQFWLGVDSVEGESHNITLADMAPSGGGSHAPINTFEPRARLRVLPT